MFGLRQKLIFGFGGLLAILLVVSGLGIAVTREHRYALDSFLVENWRSVEYGQNMIDSLARLDENAKHLTAGATNDTVAKTAIADFDTNLDAEMHNITLNGERELATKLSSAWKDYRDAYLKLKDPADSISLSQLQNLSSPVQSTAEAIVKLNLNNMTPVEGRIKELSDQSIRLLIMLAVLGTALAVVFTILMARAILQPLQAITKSFREIEQGNLDLVVHVRSRDELRQLAEAFNSMAAKLRQFRRTDQAKLERTQRTTQLAVSSLPDAIAIINPEGTIELSNQNAERLFQLTPGKSISTLKQHRLNDIYREVVQAQKPLPPRGYEAAIEVFDQGGQLKYFLPNAVPIRDRDQNLVGVTLVLADVTNLRRLDEMKSGLLSVVSHELKTPLTSIRMAVHLLLEERVGPLTSKQTELLLAAREDSDRLENIIEDLLDMGRLESGGVKLDFRPESPERLVSDAVTPLEASFRDRGVELEIRVPIETPKVLADAIRINHVFTNLLTNALKFTNPGGHVRVSVVAEDLVVRFVVEDTGVGIPEEHLGRVFDRFFRVPREKQPSGAGLGLAIAKEIVDAHGGEISVTSREGQGSQFTFALKRADMETAALKGEDHHETNIHINHG